MVADGFSCKFSQKRTTKFRQVINIFLEEDNTGATDIGNLCGIYYHKSIDYHRLIMQGLPRETMWNSAKLPCIHCANISVVLAGARY